MSHASSAQPALTPGGSIAITSCAFVEQSPAMQPRFGALHAIKPDQSAPSAEFGDDMTKGSAPLQMMKKSIVSVRGENSVCGEPVEPHSENMSEALWREKEKLAPAWLEETLPALKGPLTSDAWLGVGVK